MKKKKTDAIIIAVGSTPIIPPIPSSDAQQVLGSHALLSGKDFLAREAIVIGGGLGGIECAEYLASCGVQLNVVDHFVKVKVKNLERGKNEKTKEYKNSLF